MNQYYLYGMKISSDLSFPQLLPLEQEFADAPEVRIVCAQTSGERPDDRQRHYAFGPRFSWLSNRTAWLLVHDGREISYILKPGGNPDYLKTYILGFGMAMLALQRGGLAVHCSAVADSRGAVLIAGESGAGKSTLTAALLEQGYELMADDMALLEPRRGDRPLAYSAFPFQKLCRTAAIERGYDVEKLLYINEEKDKFLVPYTGRFPRTPLPVRAMVVLSRISGDEVQSRQASGIESLHLLAGNLFLRNLLGADRYRPDIGQLCLDAAGKMPVFQVGRPVTGSTEQKVLQQVTDFLNSTEK